jgi:lysine 6-dehydrogenase
MGLLTDYPFLFKLPACVNILRDEGFFSETPMDVKGGKLRPMDLTAKLRFLMWQLGEEEEDLTVMGVVVESDKDGRR